MARQNTNGFSEEVVSCISQSKNEPSWMLDKRLSSWNRYAENPLPAKDNEVWRKTDLSSLNLKDIVPYGAIGYAPDDKQIVPENLPDNYIIQHDSFTVSSNLSKELESKGVIFTALDSALTEHPDLVKEYFMAEGVVPEYNAFSLLHTACWNSGVLLFVPDGLEIDLPFRTLHEIGKAGTGLFQHTIVVVGEASKVTFVQTSGSGTKNGDQSLHDVQSISSGVVEIFLKNRAELKYLASQEFDDNVFNFDTKYVVSDRDSRMNWVEANVGSILSKSILEARLQGSGANVDIIGASYLNGNQHLDSYVTVQHTVPNTNGNILVEGVVDGSAKSIFQGMLKIDKLAQQTDSYMRNHNLILGDNAKADSIPRLEIEADEVKASHGVTVGQVDDEQLFYLMSRGLTKKDAKGIIVDGFFESLVSRVTDKYSQDILRNIICEKRGGFTQEHPL